jgi:Peptidase family M23
MSTFELFFVKASVCLIAFYVPYLLLLSRTTFFTANRYYLLAGVFLSFVLPLIIIPSEGFVPQVIHEFYAPAFVVSTTYPNQMDSEPSTTLTLSSILWLAYFLGAAIQTLRFFLSIRNIFMIRKKGVISIEDNVTFVRSGTIQAFTFLNMIFLPSSDVSNHIVEHEKAHVHQFHWVDLLIVRIASIIFWFNPIMIAYQRSLKLQHEYLADHSIIIRGVKLEEYLNCLTDHLNPVKTLAMISTFYFQSIKNRITMLTKKKTSSTLSGLYLVLVPIIVLILFAFAPPRYYTTSHHEALDSLVQNNLEFIAPLELDNIEIFSGFGDRIHPIFNKKMLHTGVDFVSNEGDKIIAAESGTVVTSEYQPGARGNFIVIKHDETFSTTYSHLKEMSVKAGDQVQKGQAIGLVGNTGLSTKSHLHYEVLKNGEPVDPKPYLSAVK